MGAEHGARADATGNIPSLDGLRAAAFGIVFLSHAPGVASVFPGGFGVTLFFFLSGFLITSLMRDEFRRTGRVNLRNFYLRRLLRIFPPMYLTLGLAVVLGWAGYTARGPEFVPLTFQVMHLTNYFMASEGVQHLIPGTEVLWSLAVEEHFYLVFPFLAIALLRTGSARLQVGVLSLMCAATLGWRVVQMVQGVDPWRLTYATDSRVDSILFGAILALGANPVSDRPRLTDGRAAAVALGLSLVGLVATIIPRDPFFRETVRGTLQGILMLPMYYVLITRPQWPLVRLLNLGWMRRIGQLSYTLYLVHLVAMRAVDHTWASEAGSVASLAVTIALSFLWAWLMDRWVERPLARWRKQLGVARAPLPSQA